MTKISEQFLISGQFQDIFEIAGISGISGQLGHLQLLLQLFAAQLWYQKLMLKPRLLHKLCLFNNNNNKLLQHKATLPQ